MRISRKTRLELTGIDGGRLAVEYDNIGEPFREGVLLSFEDDSVPTGNWVGVLLDVEDAVKLRDALSGLVMHLAD